MPRRPWTGDDVKTARDMREAGHPYCEIDEALSRRSGATQQRLEIANYGPDLAVRTRLIPEGLLAERNARDAARNQRTLTEDFFGDPPPGFSALSGKTGQR